jgi:hypothetical protein
MRLGIWAGRLAPTAQPLTSSNSPRFEGKLSLDARAGQCRQPDIVQEVERRAPEHVGPALDADPRITLGQRQRQQYGLQHQAGRTGTAALARLGHVKRVLPRLRPGSGQEPQGAAAQLVALHRSAAQGRCGTDTGDVLRGQTGAAASRPDVFDQDAATEQGGIAQCGSQDLAAALAVGAVDGQQPLRTARLQPTMRVGLFHDGARQGRLRSAAHPDSITARTRTQGPGKRAVWRS